MPSSQVRLRVWRLFKGAVSFLRMWIWAVFSVTATAVFLPGVVLLSGTRMLIARLSQLPTGKLKLTAKFGGELDLPEELPARATYLLALAPPLLGFVVGLVFLLPVLLNLELLGVPTVPGLASALHVENNRTAAVVSRLLSWYTPQELLGIWIGVSCWFCAAPRAQDLKAARRALRNGTPSTTKRLVAVGMTPVYWLSQVFSVFDEAMLWIGASVFLASGLLTLSCLVVLTRQILRAIFF